MLNFSDYPRFLQMFKVVSRSAELDLSLDHDRLLRGQIKGRMLCKVGHFSYKRTPLPSFEYVCIPVCWRSLCNLGEGCKKIYSRLLVLVSIDN